jgi:tetratricopeptide (TPR) repeat protein
MRFAKYGEQIVTVMPLVLIGLVRLRGRKLAIAAGAVVLLWLLIFCTFGRINYILFATLIAGVFVALCISKRHRAFVPKYALLIFVLLLSPLPFNIFSVLSTDVNVPVLSRMNDTAGMANSNNFRKMIYSVGAEMVRENPVAGVGADNFGMQVNRYRELYGAANPNDANLANAEDQIPQHAHNEYLQIAAELGIIGGLIFVWFLAGIAFIAIRSLRSFQTGSLTAFASVLGLAMFLVSSMVSAYSFRVMQNGIIFFLVLAIAASRVFSVSRSRSSDLPTTTSTLRLKPAIAIGLLVCAGLFCYSALRVGSVIVTGRANQSQGIDASMPLYELAMRLDDENPDVRHNLGMRLFRAKRYQEAVPYLQSAITIGRAPSAEVSYLATAQFLGGDSAGAEATMESAARLYPQSPFVLTRYSTLLEQNGKPVESAAVFARALEIDARAANTWHALIVSGPKALSDLSVRDSSYSSVMDLKPQSSIYAVVTERLIRFPEEQRYSFAKLSEDED